MNKTFYYFHLSAKNNNHTAQFYVGFMYMNGDYVSKDISKAIYYYKEASSFNISYSKVNLSVLYRYGIGVKKNLWYPIELLKESIRQKNDMVAKYNLAHIYLYEENVKINEDELFEMIIQSIMQNFQPSINLFLIALKNKYNSITYKIIEEEIKKHFKQKIEVKIHSFEIYEQYIMLRLYNPSFYEFFYEANRRITYLYDSELNPIYLGELNNFKKKNKSEFKAQNINSLFYEGFGITID